MTGSRKLRAFECSPSHGPQHTRTYNVHYTDKRYFTGESIIRYVQSDVLDIGYSEYMIHKRRMPCRTPSIRSPAAEAFPVGIASGCGSFAS